MWLGMHRTAADARLLARKGQPHDATLCSKCTASARPGTTVDSWPLPSCDQAAHATLCTRLDLPACTAAVPARGAEVNSGH